MSTSCRRLTSEDIEHIVDLYSNGLSIRQISVIIGWSSSAIAKWIKSAGVSRGNLDWQLDKDKRLLASKKASKTRKGRPQTKSRKYNSDIHIFKRVDTDPFAAYLYGIIVTDGNINKELRSVTLQVGNKDSMWMYYLACRLGVPLHWYNGYPHWSINSVEAANDLVDMGVCPNKTTDTQEVYTPVLHNDFIRGLIDGDGCVFINDTGIGGLSFGNTNRQLVKLIHKDLTQIGSRLTITDKQKLPGNKTHKKPYKQPFYSITTKSKAIGKYLQQIYYPECFCLERKRKIVAQMRID